MLLMICDGRVSRQPEFKQSAKGLNYLKFQIEVMKSGDKWPKRIGVTIFGEKANPLVAAGLNVGDYVVLQGEPQARGYEDKNKKPAGALEMIGQSCQIVSKAGGQQSDFHQHGRDDTIQQPQWDLVRAPVQEASFGDDDIPF